MQRIGAQTLHAWLGDGRELALLDAREDGEFGASHLFWAIPCGLAKQEVRARALLPRLATRICCVDDGRGLAEQLAGWLERIGATDVAVLDGGTPAWQAAGYGLFSGVNVPSKAFGEWVEHHYGTESVDPPELKRWIESGRKMVVLDSRTHEEFVRMSIPTGISVPGGELAYRIADMVPDPQTLVVVNCAGRTRSILGAESLRRAGIPNKVVALRNGTMGWELAGFRCDRGRTEKFDAATPKSLALALERAKRFAEASGVGVIGPLDLDRFENDPDRTLYLLDVRDPAEFRAGHRPGSRNAPGGQLVQATDNWVGVRNARIVLLDDTGVRARMSAAWLRQMGHRDVFVVEGGLAASASAGRALAPVPELQRPVPRVDVTGLVALLDRGEGSVVIDLARSIDYREGHIPGALWGVRSRLAPLRPQLAGASHVVLTSPDGVLARLAVDEVKALVAGAGAAGAAGGSGAREPAEVLVLEGGTEAWHAFGRPLVKDRTNPPDEACIDAYLRPYDRNSGVEEAMNAYLSWEIELVHQIEQDDTIAFGVAEAAA
jgi:rhodanese-related sulfurtransferase